MKVSIETFPITLKRTLHNHCYPCRTTGWVKQYRVPRPYRWRETAERVRKSLPSPSIRSAVASLRTTCSGLCRFLVVIVIKPSCNHGSQFVPHCAVSGSDDIAVTANSAIVIVSAGAKQHPGQSRLELAATNVAMAQALTPRLLEQSPDAIIVFVANPVDVVTYAAASVIQAAPGRIFGSGTILDSSRFRYLIAQRAGLAVGNVHGYFGKRCCRCRRCSRAPMTSPASRCRCRRWSPRLAPGRYWRCRCPQTSCRVCGLRHKP